MVLGRCDCCGKDKPDIAPTGVPMGRAVSDFQRLYFLCNDCMGLLVKRHEKIKSDIDKWKMEND